MLNNFTIYYKNGDDVFKLNSLKEFNRLLRIEFKEELVEFNSLEEFEALIEEFNKKFSKKKISFFLIDKNDDKDTY